MLKLLVTVYLGYVSLSHSGMIRYIFLSLCVATGAVDDRLRRLVASSRVRRGFLPDTSPLRAARVASIVEKLDHVPDQLKDALTCKMTRSLEFLALLRPVGKLYGDMSAAFLLNRPLKPTRRSYKTLKTLPQDVKVVFQSIIDKFALLPGWAESGMPDIASQQISRLENQLTDVVLCIESFATKPSYSRMLKARKVLRKMAIHELLSPFTQFGNDYLDNEISSLDDKGILLAIRNTVNMIAINLGLTHWSSLENCMAVQAEFKLLRAPLRTASVRSLGHAITSRLFTLLVRDDFKEQLMNFPNHDWTCGTFPGDISYVQRITDASAKEHSLKIAIDQRLTKYVSLKGKFLEQEMRLDSQDIQDSEAIENWLLQLFAEIEDANNEALTARQGFADCGLRYLS